jgi:hypothetical protein
MNPHLEKAIQIYAQDHIDIQPLIAWHLCHGIVVCDSDCFALGFSCFKKECAQAVKLSSGDTLFVTFSTGDMHRGLQKYIQDYEFIAFKRSFKGSNRIRIYDMYQFYSKLKQ